MTCSYTEASCHELTIPSGCHTVNAMAIGGSGGNNGRYQGGLGARIVADLEVSAGQTLYINVSKTLSYRLLCAIADQSTMHRSDQMAKMRAVLFASAILKSASLVGVKST